MVMAVTSKATGPWSLEKFDKRCGPRELIIDKVSYCAKYARKQDTKMIKSQQGFSFFNDWYNCYCKSLINVKRKIDWLQKV